MHHQTVVQQRYSARSTTLRSPCLTVFSLLLFFAASSAFVYAQFETEWHIEPQCIGGVLDSELVVFMYFANSYY